MRQLLQMLGILLGCCIHLTWALQISSSISSESTSYVNVDSSITIKLTTSTNENIPAEKHLFIELPTSEAYDYAFSTDGTSCVATTADVASPGTTTPTTETLLLSLNTNPVTNKPSSLAISLPVMPAETILTVTCPIRNPTSVPAGATVASASISSISTAKEEGATTVSFSLPAYMATVIFDLVVNIPENQSEIFNTDSQIQFTVTPSPGQRIPENRHLVFTFPEGYQYSPIEGMASPACVIETASVTTPEDKETRPDQPSPYFLTSPTAPTIYVGFSVALPVLEVDLILTVTCPVHNPSSTATTAPSATFSIAYTDYAHAPITATATLPVYIPPPVSSFTITSSVPPTASRYYETDSILIFSLKFSSENLDGHYLHVLLPSDNSYDYSDSNSGISTCTATVASSATPDETTDIMEELPLTFLPSPVYSITGAMIIKLPYAASDSILTLTCPVHNPSMSVTPTRTTEAYITNSATAYDYAVPRSSVTLPGYIEKHQLSVTFKSIQEYTDLFGEIQFHVGILDTDVPENHNLYFIFPEEFNYRAYDRDPTCYYGNKPTSMVNYTIQYEVRNITEIIYDSDDNAQEIVRESNMTIIAIPMIFAKKKEVIRYRCSIITPAVTADETKTYYLTTEVRSNDPTPIVVSESQMKVSQSPMIASGSPGLSSFTTDISPHSLSDSILYASTTTQLSYMKSSTHRYVLAAILRDHGNWLANTYTDRFELILYPLNFSILRDSLLKMDFRDHHYEKPSNGMGYCTLQDINGNNISPEEEDSGNSEDEGQNNMVPVQQSEVTMKVNAAGGAPGKEEGEEESKKLFFYDYTLEQVNNGMGTSSITQFAMVLPAIPANTTFIVKCAFITPSPLPARTADAAVTIFSGSAVNSIHNIGIMLPEYTTTFSVMSSLTMTQSAPTTTVTVDADSNTTDDEGVRIYPNTTTTLKVAATPSTTVQGQAYLSVRFPQRYTIRVTKCDVTVDDLSSTVDAQVSHLGGNSSMPLLRISLPSEITANTQYTATCDITTPYRYSKGEEASIFFENDAGIATGESLAALPYMNWDPIQEISFSLRVSRELPTNELMLLLNTITKVVNRSVNTSTGIPVTAVVMHYNASTRTYTIILRGSITVADVKTNAIYSELKLISTDVRSVSNVAVVTVQGACTNQQHDPEAGETDMDCGGSLCSPCLPGSKCLSHSDCITQYCGDTGLCVFNAANHFTISIAFILMILGIFFV